MARRRFLGLLLLPLSLFCWCSPSFSAGRPSLAEQRELTQRLNSAQSAREVLQLVEETIDTPLFNFFHISAAFAQLGRRNDELDAVWLSSLGWQKLKSTATAAGRRSDRSLLNAQATGNVVWAIGRLYLQDPSLLQVLPALVKHLSLPDVLRDLGPQGIGNTMWATVTLRESSAELLSLLPSLFKTAVRLLPEKMTARDIADCCLALPLCYADKRDPVVLGAIANATVKLLPKLSVQQLDFDIPPIVCAFAKVNVSSASLLREVAKYTEDHLDRINDWGLCALAWSYEVLDGKKGLYLTFRERVGAAVRKRDLQNFVSESQAGPQAWSRVK